MDIKKLLYRCPLLLMLFAVIVASIVVSCSQSQRQLQVLADAESIADGYPDSALALLVEIDPADLTIDSLKAKYYFVMASVRDGQGRIALSDSMISFSNDYYRGKDLKRSIRSATLLASYKFRIGEREAALQILDSLSSLNNVPDSLLIEPLRSRVRLGAYDGPNESRIKRLMAIDKDESWHSQYKFWLYFDFLFSGKNDSAVVIMDEFIDTAARNGDDEELFRYKYEKAGVLMELARYRESINLVESLINEVDDKTAIPYFLLWKSLGMLNLGNYAEASAVLAKADSLANPMSYDEQWYYNSFATVLHSVLHFRTTGTVSFMPLARIYNAQRNNLSDEQSMRREAAQRALEIENQRLTIKAKSDRQTFWLIIIVLAAMIVCGGLIWYALNKKRKALEALERNEILQKLVDESKSSQTDSSANETLRRAMLQQLGIIKMVAETPTEQNRDMLRKISSVENGTDGSLVNWQNVYDMIDNLYSGFYSRLHEQYGDILTDKEEQIIALMVAGFSTKEISVITGQTAATIYVRKSSVRKKLGVPGKEDIVAFLRRGTE